MRQFQQIKTDFPALIDEWASRFFEELDYIKEGNNGIRFLDFMAKELPQVWRKLHRLFSHSKFLSVTEGPNACVTVSFVLTFRCSTIQQEPWQVHTGEL